MLTLKDHVAGNCEFQYYRAGNLMYLTPTGLEFPVPVEDTDGATFPRLIKGIHLMRWIRKFLQENHLDKVTIPIEESKFLTPEFEKLIKNKFTP